MRLDKYLSNLGHGSRKEIKRYIMKGYVLVNGNTIKDTGLVIDPIKDIIILNQQLIEDHSDIVVLLNKPSGYLSSRKDELYPSVLNLIKEPYNKYKLNIAGRLDQDTTGLLILTNNNELLHKLTHPNQKLEKTYEVTLARPATDSDILKLKEEGVLLLDAKKKEYLGIATKIGFINEEKTKIQISITTGKYHQVKLMFKSIGNEVIKLARIEIGTIKLANLNIEEGEYKVIKLKDFKYD